jgi:G protein beta subunit-like protein
VSPNGKLLATCSSDKTAKIWNLEEDVQKKKAKYSLVHTLQGHQRWVWDCCFSAVSSYLVTASSDQSARLWDLSQGESIRHYTGHHKAVICVALNDAVAE